MLSVELLKYSGNFTLDVRWDAGEGVVALFGPSGAGKTLTLHCLAGLVRPDAGSVILRGRTLYDSLPGIHQAPRDRRLGMVFEGFALFPHLTVAQNLAFGLRRGSGRRRRIDELLERLRLQDVRKLRPSALSAGQKQRVALGRALAPDPELLLLDDPLSALDGPTRRALREDLAHALRGFGKTAVLVTHDLAEACQLADQIVVYHQGRVLQSGDKSTVLGRPASADVARVLGIRNLLEGTVVEATRDVIRLGWRGQELLVDHWPAAPDLPAPGTVAGFFIRPEHVRLMRKDRGRDGPESERRSNLIPGRIVGQVDLGPVVILQFAVEGAGASPEGYDLEVEIPRLVHEKLCVHYDLNWMVSVQPSAVEVLPMVDEADRADRADRAG